MDTLDYILNKYLIKTGTPSPIHLPMTRHGGLTTLFKELGFTFGAEIGTEQGKFAAEICRDNPGVRLFCVDPYAAYTRYKEAHQTQQRLDGYWEEAHQRLAAYNVEFVREPSMDAVKRFEDNSLDFVFIDGNHHFDYVCPDIIEWSKKVRIGGIVSGHDYKREKEDSKIPFHVMQAVHAYTDAHKITPWFLIKKDKEPSFMWVKS